MEIERPKLTVFYNTKCPVCDAGINSQHDKLVQLVKSGKVEFLDINLEPDALAAFGCGLEDIRKKLHALDGQGQLLVGADVAIAMWAITPGQKWFGKFAGSKLVRPVARISYNILAHFLYKWNLRRGHW